VFKLVGGRTSFVWDRCRWFIFDSFKSGVGIIEISMEDIFKSIEITENWSEGVREGENR
jgi:hypothetical protein